MFIARNGPPDHFAACGGRSSRIDLRAERPELWRRAAEKGQKPCKIRTIDAGLLRCGTAAMFRAPEGICPQNWYRNVAQPGSASAWGAGGRRFKSSRSDHSLLPAEGRAIRNDRPARDTDLSRAAKEGDDSGFSSSRDTRKFYFRLDLAYTHHTNLLFPAVDSPARLHPNHHWQVRRGKRYPRLGWSRP